MSSRIIRETDHRGRTVTHAVREDGTRTTYRPSVDAIDVDEAIARAFGRTPQPVQETAAMSIDEADDVIRAVIFGRQTTVTGKPVTRALHERAQAVADAYIIREVRS